MIGRRNTAGVSTVADKSKRRGINKQRQHTPKQQQKQRLNITGAGRKANKIK